MSRHFCYIFICLIYIGGFVEGAYLRIYDESINKYSEFDLDSPLDLLKSAGYNPTNATVIYAFGFTGKAEGISVRTILGTYLRIGGYNVILLNWEKEASAPLGQLYYPITALTKVAAVGKKLGKALYNLVSEGLDLERIHLIGFSLGAHLMGYAGRELQNYKLLAPRITGLDPAALLFDQRVIRPLDSSSAKYVDVHHTNPGQLGSEDSIATVDFWFNCESSIQPGCEALSFSDAAMCSHDRSWLYFSEALERTTAFEALSATNCFNWATSNGTGSTVYVGENITSDNKGNFYLSTNSIQPYGEGANGIYADNNKTSFDTDPQPRSIGGLISWLF